VRGKRHVSNNLSPGVRSQPARFTMPHLAVSARPAHPPAGNVHGGRGSRYGASWSLIGKGKAESQKRLLIVDCVCGSSISLKPYPGTESCFFRVSLLCYYSDRSSQNRIFQIKESLESSPLPSPLTPTAPGIIIPVRILILLI